MAGPETQIPNLLFEITLAKSWAARADGSSDPALAKEDYRRAVRLGRLILQDDVTLISNLVGLACVRIGARGLYEQARREGDAETMLAASLALHDADGIRQLAAERLTKITVSNELRWHWSRPLSPTIRATDEQFAAAIEMARRDPSHALRLEAQWALMGYVLAGTRVQGRQAREALAELSHDPDPARRGVGTRDAGSGGPDRSAGAAADAEGRAVGEDRAGTEAGPYGARTAAWSTRAR